MPEAFTAPARLLMVAVALGPIEGQTADDRPEAEAAESEARAAHRGIARGLRVRLGAQEEGEKLLHDQSAAAAVLPAGTAEADLAGTFFDSFLSQSFSQ